MTHGIGIWTSNGCESDCISRLRRQGTSSKAVWEIQIHRVDASVEAHAPVSRDSMSLPWWDCAVSGQPPKDQWRRVERRSSRVDASFARGLEMGSSGSSFGIQVTPVIVQLICESCSVSVASSCGAAPAAKQNSSAARSHQVDIQSTAHSPLTHPQPTLPARKDGFRSSVCKVSRPLPGSGHIHSHKLLHLQAATASSTQEAQGCYLRAQDGAAVPALGTSFGRSTEQRWHRFKFRHASSELEGSAAEWSERCGGWRSCSRCSYGLG